MGYMMLRDDCESVPDGFCLNTFTSDLYLCSCGQSITGIECSLGPTRGEGTNTKSLPGIVQKNALMKTAAAKHSESTKNGAMRQKAGETTEKQDKKEVSCVFFTNASNASQDIFSLQLIDGGR